MSKKRLYHYSFDNIHNPKYGGGGAWRDMNVHRLLTDKYEISFFTGGYPGARPYVHDGIAVRPMGFCSKSHLLNRLSFSIFCTFHSLFSHADLTVVTYSVFSPVLSFLLRPGKIIIEYHHYLGKQIFRKYRRFGVLPYIMEILVLQYAKHVITSADSVAHYFANRKGRRKNVTAVYNGFSSKLLEGVSKDNGYILAFGRIDIYMKGLDLLLPAFDKTAMRDPMVKLKIAGRGEGADIEKLKELINASHAKKRIELFLSVNEALKADLLLNASFVCIPSRFEGWCIVALEAAASGKAVLGTDIWGLSDTVKNGETGLLVPSENVDALSREMQRLSSDKKYRNQLGKSGRIWARTFSWENTAERQDEFYRKRLKRKK